MSLQLLSKYRIQLMGLSILMIMLFHTFIGRDSNIVYVWISTLDIGVEFFAILSGIGLYYSLLKNESVINFYRKRLLRILPAVFIATIVLVLWNYSYYADKGILAVFLKLTTLSTFTGDGSYWFITYILICYIIAPFVFKLLKSLKDRKIIAAILLLVISATVFWGGPAYIGNGTRIYQRIPVFLLGMYLGPFVKNGCSIHKRLIIPLGISAPIVLTMVTLYCHLTTLRIVSFVIALPTLLFLSWLFDRLPSKALQPLAFLGGITLEIYLLHENIIMLWVMAHSPNEPVGIIVTLCVTIFAAYMFHLSIEKTKNILSHE